MEILALNAISEKANDVFGSTYKLVKDSKNPVAIALRSFKMHDYTLPPSVLCVGRAGAGTNNIPVDTYAEQGVVVFNSPGANANAVKELCILSLFLAGRKVTDGINWAQGLKGKGAEVEKLIESGKGSFVGGEILGKKLGVIGLGAIGVLTANAASKLGMSVIGFDPYLSVKGALNLKRRVKLADSIQTIFETCDYISLHTPLNAQTKAMVNADTIATMKNGVNIINCSRGELCDNDAVIAAVKSGKINRYVTDFPSDAVLGIDNIIPIPHLGASTPEAEDNCAYMVAEQMVDYIENGNIVNSVNFPSCSMPKSGKQRLAIIYTDNVVGSVNDAITLEKIKVVAQTAVSGKKLNYALFDLDKPLTDKAVDALKKIANVIKVRVM